MCAATDDAAISVTAGEVLSVLAEDANGWTQVRRNGAKVEDGFVPTSYLQIIPPNQH